MDKFINISIYLIYVIIALVSILISYKVSLIMSIIVLAIESTRLVALYKKVYSVIVLVFILNTLLIGYNSFKYQQTVNYKNSQIMEGNKIITNYMASKDLRASTLKDLEKDIQDMQDISIDWWLLVGVYLCLEVCLICLVIGINKQEAPLVRKISRVTGKGIKIKPKKITKSIKETKGIAQLEYVGSYSDYYKEKGISRAKAKKLFDEWKAKGRLIKQNGKNYLKGND